MQLRWLHICNEPHLSPPHKVNDIDDRSPRDLLEDASEELRAVAPDALIGMGLWSPFNKAPSLVLFDAQQQIVRNNIIAEQNLRLFSMNYAAWNGLVSWGAFNFAT